MEGGKQSPLVQNIAHGGHPSTFVIGIHSLHVFELQLIGRLGEKTVIRPGFRRVDSPDTFIKNCVQPFSCLFHGSVPRLLTQGIFH